MPKTSRLSAWRPDQALIADLENSLRGDSGWLPLGVYALKCLSTMLAGLGVFTSVPTVFVVFGTSYGKEGHPVAALSGMVGGGCAAFFVMWAAGTAGYRHALEVWDSSSEPASSSSVGGLTSVAVSGWMRH